MKNYITAILFFGIITAMISCNQNRKAELEADRNEPSKTLSYKSENSQHQIAKNGNLSSSTAVENGKDNERKFIRTADIKFRSKDVVNTTYEVEDIINRFQGFIAFTNLKSDVDGKSVVQISVDSSQETTTYSVQNEMTIRIPNTNLDTALKSISVLVDYMDYRVIKADDISLSLLSNEMEQERMKKLNKRTEKSIDNSEKKLKDVREAEAGNIESLKNADDAKLANLELMDKVKFSTVNLTIYQKQTTTREIVAAYKPLKPFEPAFEDQLLSSLMFGLDILKSVLVFVSKFWTLALMGIVIFYIFKILRKKSLTI